MGHIPEQVAHCIHTFTFSPLSSLIRLIDERETFCPLILIVISTLAMGTELAASIVTDN